MLPIDRVKIDRSFIAHAERDESARAIVKTVTYLGGIMGLPIVAEGVETESQLRFLQDLGCDEAQGYLFARPLPAGECEEVFADSGALKGLIVPKGGRRPGACRGRVGRSFVNRAPLNLAALPTVALTGATS